MTITIPRILPWLVVAGGIYANSDRADDLIKSAKDYAKEQVVRHEMASLVSFMETDSISMSLPSAATFPHYVRDNAQTLLRDRDVADDLWGTKYRLEVDDDGRTFRVRSAGADTQYETDDDIVIEGVAAGR